MDTGHLTMIPLGDMVIGQCTMYPLVNGHRSAYHVPLGDMDTGRLIMMPTADMPTLMPLDDMFTGQFTKFTMIPW